MKTSNRKTQHDEYGIKSYMVKGERNNCGCGSNCYHYQYDGEDVIGVCNACGKDIHIILDEYKEDYLSRGVWK